MLAVDVEKRLGDFTIAAKFEAPDGVTALFGPSGSGKTSIVSMVAGLMRPDRGRIMCNGALLFDSNGADEPPHRRHIGYVFQDGRLFPHMTVAQNLDYGRRMYRLPRNDSAHSRIVNMLDIGHLLERRPGHLSGGERQRVAIGRALLMHPRLLLARRAARFARYRAKARDLSLSAAPARRTGADDLRQSPCRRIAAHRHHSRTYRRRPRDRRRRYGTP